MICLDIIFLGLEMPKSLKIVAFRNAKKSENCDIWKYKKIKMGNFWLFAQCYFGDFGTGKSISLVMKSYSFYKYKTNYQLILKITLATQYQVKYVELITMVSYLR